MITVYGTDLCIDCRNLFRNLEKNHIPYELVNITGSMPEMKAFLALRDREPLYDAAKAAGGVGIPTIRREDDTLTLDWEQYLKSQGIRDLVYGD